MMQLSNRDFAVMTRGLRLLQDYKPTDRHDCEYRRLALCLLRKIERKNERCRT